MSKKLQHLVIAACLTLIPYSLHAGTDLKIETNEFTGSSSGQYKLEIGPECALLKTIKSSLISCNVLHIKGSQTSPTLLLSAKSEGWDVLTYKNMYKTIGIPTIIKYNNGTELKTRIPGELDTRTIRGGTVMETLEISLGSIKKELQTINSMRFQFGSNEYFVSLDKELTKKILNP